MKSNTPISRYTGCFFLLLFLCVLATGCKQNNDEDLYRKIPAYELQSDFKYLLRKIKNTNPQPYINCSEKHIDSVAKSVQNRLNTPMSPVEFYRVVSPFVSEFNDAHFSMGLPDVYFSTYKKQGGKFLPFTVVIDGDRLFANQVFLNDSTFTKGTEIFSINHIKSKKIKETMLGFKSGDSYPFKIGVVEARFQKLMWVAYGPANNFDVIYKGGHQLIKGLSATAAHIDTEVKNPFDLQINNGKKQKTAILRISRLTIEDQPAFEKYVKNTFAKIDSEHIKNIIIDIRNNGGGSTALARSLYNYTTTKPYRFDNNEIYFENGKLKTLSDTSLSTPTPVKNKFTGKVYMLINSFTYSSAYMMANAFKYYKMGVLLGDSSCEKMHISGEVSKIILPLTKLEVYSPLTAFTLPNNTNISKRLYPDHYLSPGLKDRLDNKDVLLKYCLQLINNNK